MPANCQRVKSFFESLQAFTTPGKLKNFRYTVTEVALHQASLTALQEIDNVRALLTEHGQLISWLSSAEGVLPADHDWVDRVKTARKDVLDKLAVADFANLSSESQWIGSTLLSLKKAYISEYIGLHTKARLGLSEDRRKVALQKDERLCDVNKTGGDRPDAPAATHGVSEPTGWSQKLFCAY